MAGFERTLDELFAQAAPRVGARRRLRRGRADAPVGAAARRAADRRDRPRRREAPGRVGDAPARRTSSTASMLAENLPFADGEFDLASAIEVLEHVPDPAHTVAEMARVAQAPPAGVRAARAALADAEHGPRRVPGRTSATRPGTSTTGRSARSCGCSSQHGEVDRDALAVPVDDAACPARRLAQTPDSAAAPPADGAAALLRLGRAHPVGRDRLDGHLHVRSTSRSRATRSTPTSTAASR